MKWAFVMILTGIAEATPGQLQQFEEQARISIPLESREECRDFAAHHSPLVSFGESILSFRSFCEEVKAK